MFSFFSKFAQEKLIISERPHCKGTGERGNIQEHGMYIHEINTYCNKKFSKALNCIKKTGRKQEHIREKTLFVMPYLHCPSHNVKKVVQQYGICAVFSAPCKLKKVCPLLTRTRRELSCKKNHQMRFTSCVPNVFYEIPLSCGWSYIGQTSRCFNKRAQEHK